MCLSVEPVSKWIDAFPITVHMSDQVDYIYSTYTPEQSAQQQHEEELKQAEVEKYTHLLEDHRPHLYNPITGQIAPADVNDADSIMIGDKMEKEYVASLPNRFYYPINNPSTY